MERVLDFDSPLGDPKRRNLIIPGTWIMSVAGGTSTATEDPEGTVNVTGDGANAARGDQSFPTRIGQLYTVSLFVTGAGATSRIGTTIGGAEISPSTARPAGLNTFTFVATATLTWIRLFRTATSLSASSSISVI